VRTALRRRDLQEGEQAVAMCYRWTGSATFRRLDDFVTGVRKGLSAHMDKSFPLIIVGDGDIGGLVGIHCLEEQKMTTPIVSIDGINLKEFDFIDIGAMLETSGAVPVVIKSLVFPTSAALGRVESAKA
jgi:ethanolamine utilization protein EutA